MRFPKLQAGAYPRRAIAEMNPTISLDARSEHEVFQRVTDLTRGKMALLISHRFSIVRMADRIVVREDGQIAVQGSQAQTVLLGRS